MSQKTNPLSLRLQKSNQNFSSPWYSDYFFNENFHYQSSIEKYISLLLKESQHSKAFFSAKNDYRKSNIFLVIQDIRAQRKEKMLSFNLKSNRFLPKNVMSYKDSTFEEVSFFALQKIKNNREKQVALLKKEGALYNAFVESEAFLKRPFLDSLPKILLKKKIKKDFREKPFIKAYFLKNLLVAQQTIKTENREKSKNVKRLAMDKSNLKTEVLKKLRFLLSKEKSYNFYDKSVINGFVTKKTILPKKDNVFHSYNVTSSEENKSNAGTTNTHGALPLTSVQQVSFFRRKILNDLLKHKQNYNPAFFSYTSDYLDFFAKRYNFHKNRNNLKHWWEIYWKDNIRTNSCLSFSEKVVNNSFYIPSFVDLNSRDLTVGKHSSSKDLTFKEKYISPYFLSLSERQESCVKTKKTSKNSTSSFPITTYFEPIRFIDDSQNVKALLDNVVALIEKRVSFGQIKSKLFEDLSKNPQIKGVRISCSGRLGGRSKKAQKAKLQSDQWGGTALNVFSSKVLFAKKSAYTSYGKVGVKIWLSFK